MTQRPDYEFVDTPEGFQRVAEVLRRGRGPFAVDTERASAFRYDDRAFLVQIHRRGAGTFLIAPEGVRGQAQAALSPVLNGEEWIIHAAGDDLRAVAMLGLYPGTLFDTELAARFAGFDKPNLGAMVAHFTGVQLEKGHGRENWSRTPLPQAWLDYAAFDVVYLHALAEALTEVLADAGLLPFAEAEFAHLIDVNSDLSPVERSWRDLKGLSTVRTSRGLHIARELHAARERRAVAADISPSSVLPSSVIVDIARKEPKSAAELVNIPGFPARQRRAVAGWMAELDTALQSDPGTWPSPVRRDPRTPPSRSTWQRHNPENWDALNTAKTHITRAASELGIPAANVLAPSVLRQTVWNAAGETPETHTVMQLLLDSGARQWQAEITAPLVAEALRCPESSDGS